MPAAARGGGKRSTSSSVAHLGVAVVCIQTGDHERVTPHQCRVGMSRIIIIKAENPRAMRCTSFLRLHAGKHSNQSHPESSRSPRLPRYSCESAALLRPVGRRQLCHARLACSMLSPAWEEYHVPMNVRCYERGINICSPSHIPQPFHPWNITSLGMCLLPKLQFLRFQPRIAAGQLINVGRSHAETRKTRRNWTLKLSLPLPYQIYKNKSLPSLAISDILSRWINLSCSVTVSLSTRFRSRAASRLVRS